MERHRRYRTKMRNFITYFFSGTDSKGNHYFPVKPCAFLLGIFLPLTIILLFFTPEFSILTSTGVFLSILFGYMDYKMDRAINPSEKEKRERKLNKLLDFIN